SSTYRCIIDEVVTHCRADFDEMGIEQAVLDALQASWESKLVNTRVADFSGDPRLGPLQIALAPSVPRPEELSKDDLKPSTSDSKNQNSSPSKRAEKPGRDSDEINSDLDDSEDEADAADVEENENGGGVNGSNNPGDLVIALYDKVQRVKNKWKITLKDGIMSVQGKDYVFHKCNG
ncbi:transcription factor IIA, alpha/beta subunit-domain-containing protein, partial [Phakopsora pachyrhizi]